MVVHGSGSVTLSTVYQAISTITVPMTGYVKSINNIDLNGYGFYVYITGYTVASTVVSVFVKQWYNSTLSIGLAAQNVSAFVSGVAY